VFVFDAIEHEQRGEEGGDQQEEEVEIEVVEEGLAVDTIEVAMRVRDTAAGLRTEYFNSEGVLETQQSFKVEVGLGLPKEYEEEDGLGEQHVLKTSQFSRKYAKEEEDVTSADQYRRCRIECLVGSILSRTMKGSQSSRGDC
jgi:hypothetical protein